MARAASFSKPIQVLYQDDQYVVFLKPPGILTTPNKESDLCLTQLVNEQSSDDESKLHPCHRLDKETSGVILYAKGKKYQQLMREEFHKQTVHKFYTVFVHGQWAREDGKLSSMIKDLHQKKFASDSRGKKAETRFCCLEIHSKFSVLDIEPVTGRTNQIRIHLAQTGHPLVGESKYAFRKDFSLKFKRTALHAREIQWTHPVTKVKMTVTAPLARDMQNFLNKHT